MPNSPNRSRRSLRGRLAAAFVTVAFLTVLIATTVMHFTDLYRPVTRGRNLLLMLLSVPIAAMVGSFTSKVITRRLSSLRDAAERLDLRELSLRVPVQGDDEVADLARSFNAMVERLEQGERARRELFADVAHELRHPLSVLTGRLELMQDGVVPVDGEQLLHLQEMVLALNRLVGDLRDLSLAEVGRLSLQLAPIDLGTLIEDLQENMEPVAAAKAIELTTELPPDLPQITADRDRIRQVLVNLLANALQYTPQGGRVHLRAWADGAEVHVEVADTGPGVPAADLPHLFDRFYRTDKARTRTTGGSGLGLAIVRSLVGLHGGRVGAQSEVGEGSRFTISLPIQQP